MNCRGCCNVFDLSRPFNIFRRYSSRVKNRKIVLMLVGLDNAGKSSTAKKLAREPVDTVVPTVGFNSVKLKHRGFTVTIYDLGGSGQIRGIWHRYFADVHGIIFVVDASDQDRIDESRKILEEMLIHDKLAGKPLLVLANKQDREGALDELDIVERLNLESLVNHQKCPTLVESCSAAGAPRGAKARLDPGILNGYRWLLRRIITDYERLNSRVERDSAEQKSAAEAERERWRSRSNHVEDETDTEAAPRDPTDPFKPIHSLVKEKEMNGIILVNGHVEPVSEDSPDSSSHTVESGEGGVFIPLHSPTTSGRVKGGEREGEDTSPGRGGEDAEEPRLLVISHPQPSNVVLAVKEQFEWKMRKQKGRRMLLRRVNRTAPSSASSAEGSSRGGAGGEGGERVLPPLKASHCSWARPSTAQSLPTKGWGLGLSLEEVEPPEESSVKEVVHAKGKAQCLPESPVLQVVHGPRSMVSSDSDQEDVMCAPHSR